MAYAEHFLRWYIFISDDSHYSRHENRDDSLHCIENADFGTHSDSCEVTAHGSQIRSPDGILQEIHNYQPHADSVVLHITMTLFVFVEVVLVNFETEIRQMYKFLSYFY